MKDFQRASATSARLTAAPDQVERFRDFMQRRVPIHRAGALWRIDGEVRGGLGCSHFALSRVIELKRRRDPYAYAGVA